MGLLRFARNDKVNRVWYLPSMADHSKVKKKRLDILLVDKGLAKSREQAQAFILAGEVYDEKGVRLDKASLTLKEDASVELRLRQAPFASRAGQKMDHALEKFGLDVKGKVCLDVGASTGGFTDCLLKRDAKHVFAIDVGYGQLDLPLRENPKVSNMERTNARSLTLDNMKAYSPLAEEASFVVMDVSFISLKKIVEPLKTAIPSLRNWVLLFKPQFEVGQKFVQKGGVVKNQEAIDAALHEFSEWMRTLGFKLRHGPETSPLPGKKSGNVEYLLHYEAPQSS
jgi:23S rRNA (cytidine1920-2'-O)/16S rRNA (cytidine1409-2'-O)-methyltransferase